MSPELEEKIFALKPEWFKALQFGVECNDGWFHIIIELTSKLIALADEEPDNFESFEVVQIKEKFGALRFYIQTGENCSRRRADALIKAYEYMSSHTCEICGKAARCRTLGYIQTLCRYPHDQAEG